MPPTLSSPADCTANGLRVAHCGQSGRPRVDLFQRTSVAGTANLWENHRPTGTRARKETCAGASNGAVRGEAGHEQLAQAGRDGLDLASAHVEGFLQPRHLRPPSPRPLTRSPFRLSLPTSGLGHRLELVEAPSRAEGDAGERRIDDGNLNTRLRAKALVHLTYSAPPPARVIPRSTTSAASCGGVRSSVSFTASTMRTTGPSSARCTSSDCRSDAV